MDIKTARAAIEAILASIPDDELPKFDKVEEDRNGTVVVWWGGTGYHLGRATRNGKREPLIYHERASWDAIEAEMTYRADKLLFENGDNPKGLKLGKKIKAA